VQCNGFQKLVPQSRFRGSTEVRKSGSAEGAVKNLWQCKLVKNKKIVANYACFRQQRRCPQK